MNRQKLRNALSILRESTNGSRTMVKENFGKLSPVLLKLDKFLLEPFKMSMRSSTNIGQNSDFDEVTKVKLSDLKKLLVSDPGSASYPEQVGFIVYLNRLPCFSFAKNPKVSYFAVNGMNIYKAIYPKFIDFNGFDPQKIKRLGNSIETFSDNSMKLSKYGVAARPYKKVYSLEDPEFIIVDNITNFDNSRDQMSTLNKITDRAFNPVATIIKILTLHKKHADDFDQPPFVVSVVLVRPDRSRMDTVRSRIASNRGVIPLPGDPGYKDFVNDAQHDFKRRVETFRVDKLAGKIRFFSIEDFKDPEKLEDAIRSSNILGEELIKIGDFRYKLGEFDTGITLPNTIRSSGSTVVTGVQFTYEMIESDADKRQAILSSIYRTPMTEDEFKNAIKNIGPRKFYGNLAVYTDFKNPSNTKIKVFRVEPSYT